MALMLAIIFAGILIITALLLASSPGKPAPYFDAQGQLVINSISEKISVTIGDIEQGMIIRGKNVQNPVLLFLHGGPGMPEYFLAEKYASGLEDAFTVCYWDQRGAGLSYSNHMDGDEITAKRLITDTIDVTNYLSTRFGQEKIYLLAHSWGTFIGIQAAAQAPELYHAYIGMAQVSYQPASEKLAYTYMLSHYKAAGQQAMVNRLKKYPILESEATLLPYFISPLRDKAMHQLGIGTMHGMTSVIKGIFLPAMASRTYTLGEKINIWRAKAFLRNETTLIDELFTTNLAQQVPTLDMPVFFISGAYDYTVSHTLSRQYFDILKAPLKGFYTLRQSAHSPLFEEPEAFMEIIQTDVLNVSTHLADH